MGERDLDDRRAKVTLSDPESLGKGFFDYARYRLTVHGAEETRDVVRAGKVARRCCQLILPATRLC